VDTEAGFHLSATVREDGSGKLVVTANGLTVPIILDDYERRQLIALLYHPLDEMKDQFELEYAAKQIEEDKKPKIIQFPKKGE
jgi:hypothetical protein